MNLFPISLVLIVSLLLTSCSFFQVDDGKKIKEKTILPPSVNVTSKDQDICMKDFKGLQQESCLTNFFTRKAIKESDIKVCENIVTLNLKNSCINNVLTMKALIQNDINVCKIIIDKKSQLICRNNVRISKIASQKATSTISK